MRLLFQSFASNSILIKPISRILARKLQPKPQQCFALLMNHRFFGTDGKMSIRDEIIINSSKAPSSSSISANSTSSSPQTDDSLEKEKYLYGIKRDMTTFYTQGNYQDALKKAIELQDEVIELYGKNNAIYASCLNNIALMLKLTGQHEASLEQYMNALQVYKEVHNNNTLSVSYASTLYNIGILYKQMAETSKGLDKSQFIDRAEEAIQDSHKLRLQLHGRYCSLCF